MKTIKVLLNFIICITFIGCSTDEIQTSSEDLESKSRTTNSRVHIGNNYGMPFDDQYINEDLLIKIIYNDVNEEGKIDIRRKFSLDHPDLVLVKVANRESSVEYWFLKSLKKTDHSGSTVLLPEEDPDEGPTVDPNELHLIKQKIMDHRFIDLY